MSQQDQNTPKSPIQIIPANQPVEQQPAAPAVPAPAQQQQVNMLQMLVDGIQAYMKNRPLKIIIGTPCYGGLLHSGYFQSVCELCVNFTKIGIPFELCTIGSESLIPRARNGIVAKFMGDREATHLMFIDADITFPWFSIVKLILMDKELSGGCYPKKMINWDKIIHNVKKPERDPVLYNDKGEINEELLIAKSLDYVFNPEYEVKDGKLLARVENGMIKVKNIGTGFMMIKKCVFDIMMHNYKDLKYMNNVAGYHSDKCSEYFYSLFDTEIDPASRVYLSEDYLFCKRWLEQGGDCWMDLSINLTHSGSMDFKGAVSLSISELDTLNKDFKITNRQQSTPAAGGQ